GGLDDPRRCPDGKPHGKGYGKPHGKGYGKPHGKSGGKPMAKACPQPQPQPQPQNLSPRRWLFVCSSQPSPKRYGRTRARSATDWLWSNRMNEHEIDRL